MIVSVRDPNILSNLDPQQLINYLIARGWQQENLGDNANNQESVWVLTLLNKQEYQLARTAYTERLAIVCTGDLIKQNGNFVLLKLGRICFV